MGCTVPGMPSSYAAPPPFDVLLRRELLDRGWRDHDIAREVRRGGLVRIRHGAYVAAEGADRLDATTRHRLRARAVLRTGTKHAVLSHQSALLELGVDWWDLPLDTVHLTRRDARAGRAEAGVKQHRAALTEDEVVEVNGLPVTGPVRTVLDAARSAGTERGLVMVDSLLHQGWASPDDLWSAYGDSERWPGSAHLRMVISLADGRSGSVGESRARYLFWLMRLPRPVLQHPVLGEGGRVLAFLDFAWPELGVAVEFDGRRKYLTDRRPGESAEDVVIREKLREDRVRELTGWRFVRITWADLGRPEQTARRIRAAMTAAAAA